MTRILAILNRTSTADSVLVSADLLAARIGLAEIHVLHVQPTAKGAGTKPPGDQARVLRDRYERWMLASRGLGGAQWREVATDARAAVGSEGSQGDFIVIGHVFEDDPPEVGAAMQGALFDTGMPVLVAPPAIPNTLGRRPAIAWEESASLSRTLRSAGLVLTRAEKVLVLETGGMRGPGSAVSPELRGILGRSDHVPEIQQVESSARHPDEALLRQAAEAGADLLVTAAYARSRLVEWLSSGSPRDLLRHAKLPLLMQN